MPALDGHGGSVFQKPLSYDTVTNERVSAARFLGEIYLKPLIYLSGVSCASVLLGFKLVTAKLSE
jgi:hypothetical protein